jgi:photosystem II stability/assembly factor-like uncharacterized protein
MNHAKILVLSVILAMIVGCAPATPPPSEADRQVEVETTVTEAPAAPTEVAADTSVPAQEEVVHSWEVIRQFELDHETDGVRFFDDEVGVTVDRDGVIHHTLDGGETWLDAANPPFCNYSWCAYGFDIVDEKLAWFIGNLGQVVVSTDGLQSWQSVSRLRGGSQQLTQLISFVDAQTGWAATREHLWATHDGGQTWTKLTLPDGVKNISFVDILLRTAHDGYLLDASGTLYITSDGGKSWSAQTITLDEAPVSFPDFTHSAAIRFFDTRHAMIVFDFIGNGKSQVLALRTIDGGQTWTQESVPAKFGILYLSHDGTILAIADFMNSQEITVLRTAAPALADTSESVEIAPNDEENAQINEEIRSMFDYDPKAPLDIEEISVEQRDSITIHDRERKIPKTESCRSSFGGFFTPPCSVQNDICKSWEILNSGSSKAIINIGDWPQINS